MSGFFMLSGLTLCTTIVNSGYTINLTENFGNLWKDGHVKQEIGGDKLVGDYANTIYGLSIGNIILSILNIAAFMYVWFSKHKTSVLKKNITFKNVLAVSLIFAICLGVVVSALNLNFTENFLNIKNLDTDPSPIVLNENYKLRGHYGNAMVTMASIGGSYSLIVLMWILGINLDILNFRKM